MRTDGDIQRACSIVDYGGAADLLEQALRTDRRGRKRTLSIRTFLVGAILTVQDEKDLVIEDIHRTLTTEIARPWQWKLGVLRSVEAEGRQETEMLSKSHLYQLTKTIAAKLDYSQATQPDLDDHERERRQTALTAFARAIISGTLLPTASRTRAIDSSGVWAWGRGRANTDDLEADDHAAAAAAAAEANAAESGANSPGDRSHQTPKRQPHDVDARWGVKTHKEGRAEIFFGYELHAVTRVPDRRAPRDSEPLLIEEFALTPASQDIVEPTLAMLDAARHGGHVIDEVLVDRHYSYKTAERWASELRRRGIDQHLDLHPNDHGFRDYNGAKLAAGWLHCPGTPDRLGTIPKPAPNAEQEHHDAFAALIEERKQYAFRRVERHRARDGRARWECPALAGSVGCPLREGRVEVAQELGLPIVANPPDPEAAPACCTQRAVSTKADAQLKLAQPHYWGDAKWRQSYARRSYVEGSFGNIKNPSTENLRRGFFRVTGLGPVTVLVAIAVAACNLRQLRNWHQRTGLGDPSHPLLAPDAEDHGFIPLTAEQAAQIDADYASQAEAA